LIEEMFDDTAVVPVAHAFDGQAAEVEGGGQVDADDVIPLLARHAMERRVPGDASIVHEHLDRAEILGDLRDPFGAGVIVADIPFEAFDAEFLGTLWRLRHCRRSSPLP